jgi:hypothetical protein
MSEVNVEAGLKQLSAGLREVRALLEWAELAEAETRPGTPPSFRLDHHVQEDLVVQTGGFIKTAMDLAEVLSQPGGQWGTEAERTRWKKKLFNLEEQFRKLRLRDTFIRA